VLTLYVVPALYSYLSSKKKVSQFDMLVSDEPKATDKSTF